MTRVNKYDTYKDSGIEWIGEIPQEWSLVRAKHLFYQSFEKGGNDLTLLSATQNEGVIPKDRLEGVVQVKEDADLSVFKTVKIADFVISLRSFQGGFEHSNFNGVITPAYTVFRNKKPINHNYFKMLFKSDGFIAKINSLTTGIREGKNIQYDDFADMILPWLDIEEQQAIADYLDKKCGEIDKVVEAEKSVIEKLKEYKQSVITEAVTKGLDKSVPLKDSGIEWIDKIPQHWNITQISKLYEVILGKMLCTNPSTDTDTLENYLCSANIKFDGVKTDEIKQMYFNKNEKDMYLLNKNDIVISEGGDAGTASIYNGEAQPCYIQNAVHKVCTFDINKMLNKFLYYWIFLCKKCGYIDLICNKATIMHYTKEKVSKTPIVFLPIEEQQQIIDYLDKKCSEIDKAIADKEQLIEKFIEYKKSLIYECVTGKRKVV